MKIEDQTKLCQPTVSVYLACRDRIKYIEEVIESILAQTRQDFEFIISDNSSGTEVGDFVKTKYPHIRYCKRSSVDVLTHFNLIHSEVKTDYFVIFHDDDVMLPEYLDRMLKAIDKDIELAAVGCNAFISWDSSHTDHIWAPQIIETCLIKSPAELFNIYMGIKSRFHAPFPSYLYRLEKTRSIRFQPNEGGKYADVSFLMKLTAVAPLIWIPDRLMRYRIHASNDRKQQSLRGKLNLRQFVLRFSGLTRDDESVLFYRFVYLMKYVTENFKSLIFSKKKTLLIILKFGTRYTFSHKLTLLSFSKRFIFQHIIK
jgi:glycosyltransferase involved in cell wall biosynthesis